MKYEYVVLRMIGDTSNPLVFPLFFMISGTEIVFTGKHKNETELLSEVGQEGWELIRFDDNRVYTFKRVAQSENLSFDADHYVKGLTDAIYELDQERGLADMVFDDENSQKIYKVAIANAICMILDRIVMADGNHPNSDTVIKLQAKYMSGTD